MPKFLVRCTTMAYMGATREVEADSAAEAQRIVEESWNDTDWEFEGECDGLDQGPEVMSVRQL